MDRLQRLQMTQVMNLARDIDPPREPGGFNPVSNTIETLFTHPFEETDSNDWFDAYYDPSTNKFSNSHGAVRNEPKTKEERERKDKTEKDGGRRRTIRPKTLKGENKG